MYDNFFDAVEIALKKNEKLIVAIGKNGPHIYNVGDLKNYTRAFYDIRYWVEIDLGNIQQEINSLRNVPVNPELFDPDVYRAIEQKQITFVAFDHEGVVTYAGQDINDFKRQLLPLSSFQIWQSPPELLDGILDIIYLISPASWRDTFFKG